MEKMKVEHEAHIAEMEAEHKARIAELKTKTPGMPPVECKARVVELKCCAVTIDTHLVEIQKLLNGATHTWMTMEEIDGLIEVYISLKKNQQKFDELTTTTKDLSTLEHMLKMKESTKLQIELQNL